MAVHIVVKKITIPLWNSLYKNQKGIIMKARSIKLIALGLAATTILSGISSVMALAEEAPVEMCAEAQEYTEEPAAAEAADEYESVFADESTDAVYDASVMEDPASEAVNATDGFSENGGVSAEPEDIQAAEEAVDAADGTETVEEAKAADGAETVEDVEAAEAAENTDTETEAGPEADVVEASGDEAAEEAAEPETLMTEMDVNDAALVQVSEAVRTLFAGKDELSADAAAVGDYAAPADESEDAGDTLQNAIDTWAFAVPGGKAMAAPFKTVLDIVLGAAPSVSAREFRDHLEVIRGQIKETARSLDENMHYTEALGIYGSTFDHMEYTAGRLMDEIMAVSFNDALTKEQKDEKIAALYDREAAELSADLELVSGFFRGETLKDAWRKTIYQVIYENCKADHMFEGEVLDHTSPYLTEALLRYVSAQYVLNQVLDAREAVEGPERVTGTRKQIEERFTGSFDEEGNNKNNGIFQILANYLNTDRYTFINGGKARVDLRREIVVKDFNRSDDENDRIAAKEYVNSQVLTAEQVDAIMEKAAKSGKSLTEYLTSVGFTFGAMDAADFDAITRAKAVYMLRGNGIEEESHYTGMRYDIHKYHNFFISGYNAMNKDARNTRPHHKDPIIIYIEKRLQTV